MGPNPNGETPKVHFSKCEWVCLTWNQHHVQINSKHGFTAKPISKGTSQCKLVREIVSHDYAHISWEATTHVAGPIAVMEDVTVKVGNFTHPKEELE